MPFRLIFAVTDVLNKESGGINSIFKLIGLIILCILIIVASYYTTKCVGKKQLGTGKASNFRSIDVFRVTPNKYLQIVEIGERYFCIAVTKEAITVVCELQKDDIKHFPQQQGPKSFKECMSDIVRSRKKGENAEKSGIGEVLEKIKEKSEKD